jgi:hypothetical protein
MPTTADPSNYHRIHEPAVRQIAGAGTTLTGTIGTRFHQGSGQEGQGNSRRATCLEADCRSHQPDCPHIMPGDGAREVLHDDLISSARKHEPAVRQIAGAGNNADGDNRDALPPGKWTRRPRQQPQSDVPRSRLPLASTGLSAHYASRWSERSTHGSRYRHRTACSERCLSNWSAVCPTDSARRQKSAVVIAKKAGFASSHHLVPVEVRRNANHSRPFQLPSDTRACGTADCRCWHNADGDNRDALPPGK